MSFVSPEFGLLMAAVLLLLVIIRPVLWRKLIVLAASCVFYAYWDVRFLGLILLVTVLDFAIARNLGRSRSASMRMTLLVVSLVVNLGLLAIFKYFNFFIDSLDFALAPTGWRLANLNIILPVGISFYTFETLSYVIDVFRGDAQPTQSLLDYAIFVTFFPRLVAGPIMRATHFLPQLQRGIQLDRNNLFIGFQIFVRGLFKKIVVADNLSFYVDQVYSAPGLYSSSTTWFVILAYSIQILFDFSGYSDMAIGIGRMLGFELPQNFNLPYAAQSVTEFWQRWHISLSTWLRDYLYIGLGGNRKGRIRTYVNLMVTMLLGGLWHGASWNFVFWGGLHGSYLVVERLLNSNRRKAPARWSTPVAWIRATLVFILVSVTWVFFRSPSPDKTVVILGKLFLLQNTGFDWVNMPALLAIAVIVCGGFLMRGFAIKVPLVQASRSYAPALLLLQLLIVFFLSPRNISPFIYFQF